MRVTEDGDYRFIWGASDGDQGYDVVDQEYGVIATTQSSALAEWICEQLDETSILPVLHP